MKIILLVSAITLSLTVFGQQKMIVFFTDKPVTDNLSQNFTQRSIDRRLSQNIVWDENDLPVDQYYIHQLQNDGRVLNVSRWLNAVSFESNIPPEDLKLKYSFIERIQAAGKPTVSANKELETVNKSLNYGVGVQQAQQINVSCLHDLGYRGAGVYLAIIDAGFFRMDSINYFDTLYNESRVLDTKNYVWGGTNVYYASGHGTSVASCIVGEKGMPDEFAGTGVDVDLALYLTEDVTSETEIEEFNLVAALERSDSLGVDVASISLGYFDFDDTTTSHVYADLDGQTTVSAIGVNVAASKGIAVVMAAGNSGPSNISTPCDADDGLCIGAVDEFGMYAPFSSVGPSADGQVKPDVAARGLDAWVADAGNGMLTQASGTSFATPITSGAVACLRQAHPTASVAEVFSAIQQSASQSSNPDDLLGYGIPDFCVAHQILTQLSISEKSNELVKIYPNPADQKLIIEAQDNAPLGAELYNAIGQPVWNDQVSGMMEIDVSQLTPGTYTLVLQGTKIERHKVVILH